ncbi:hypothetical protein, partial [Turicimonas muris]|uniref:hypothetical protein n=4 Tax=Turicimonas muris TaxID=1796652 RepID=UPI001C3F1138
QFRKGPANRIWNVGMFTGTALVPNGMPGGVRGTGNNRPYSILLSKCTVKEQKRFLCFKFGAKWFASIWFQYLKEFLQKNPKRRKALLSQGFADFSQVLEKLD